MAELLPHQNNPTPTEPANNPRELFSKAFRGEVVRAAQIQAGQMTGAAYAFHEGDDPQTTANTFRHIAETLKGVCRNDRNNHTWTIWQRATRTVIGLEVLEIIVYSDRNLWEAMRS